MVEGLKTLALKLKSIRRNPFVPEAISASIRVQIGASSNCKHYTQIGEFFDASAFRDLALPEGNAHWLLCAAWQNAHVKFHVDNGEIDGVHVDICDGFSSYGELLLATIGVHFGSGALPLNPYCTIAKHTAICIKEASYELLQQAQLKITICIPDLRDCLFESPMASQTLLEHLAFEYASLVLRTLQFTAGHGLDVLRGEQAVYNFTGRALCFNKYGTHVDKILAKVVQAHRGPAPIQIQLFPEDCGLHLENDASLNSQKTSDYIWRADASFKIVRHVRALVGKKRKAEECEV